MQLVYRILAEIVLVVHVSYITFVVAGMVLIIVGILRRWEWSRNVWFRVVHLAMILIVVAEAWLGIVCPLTTWENTLRRLAGQEVDREGFIADLLHRAVFFEFPPWMFTVAYTLFGLAVLATFVWAPPRRPRQRRASAND